MGLDMYLNTFPRTNELTIAQLDAISDYHTDILRGNMHLAPEGFDTWNKIQQQIAKEIVDAATTTYYDWDDNHELPRSSIGAQVGYWRKANAIHNWFVENVQDGEDDCDYHREVTADDLQELITVCTKVLTYAKLVPGRIRTGIRFSNGKAEEMYENGLVVSNPGICEALLPTSDGFFFGSQEYNEYYLADLQETIKICTEALSTTDFGTQMLYYCSSW